MLKSYLVLLMAIVFETVATSFLKQSEQFTKFWPSVVTVAGYAAAFYCLSLVLTDRQSVISIHLSQIQIN